MLLRGLLLETWSSRRGAYHWGKAFSVSSSRSEVGEAIESRDSYGANRRFQILKILSIITQDPDKPKDHISSTSLLVPRTCQSVHTRESFPPNG
jgi:hypothetical protein